MSYLFKNIPKARHDHSWWPGALDTLSSSHVRQAELLIDAAASQPALSEDADTVGAARKACTSCKNTIVLVRWV